MASSQTLPSRPFGGVLRRREDRHRYRIDFARTTYGVEPINFDDVDDPAAISIDSTDSREVDASIDAVGYEAEGRSTETELATLELEDSSGKVLRQEGDLAPDVTISHTLPLSEA